jgi:hypothetical protein
LETSGQPLFLTTLVQFRKEASIFIGRLKRRILAVFWSVWLVTSDLSKGSPAFL